MLRLIFSNDPMHTIVACLSCLAVLAPLVIYLYCTIPTQDYGRLADGGNLYARRRVRLRARACGIEKCFIGSKGDEYETWWDLEQACIEEESEAV